MDAVLKNTAAAGEYLERLKKIARNPAEGAARKTAMSGEHVQAELIREAEELCRVYGLTVKGDKTELPELEAVWQDIKRAVLNIVRNAAEHTPRGGQIYLQFIWTAPWLEILVTDEGPGFTKKALRHDLEPMYTEAESRPQNGHMGIALLLPGRRPEASWGKRAAVKHGGRAWPGKLPYPARINISKWVKEKEKR